MRPEPLALTLDQTQFRTVAELYLTDDYRCRIAQFRDFLGVDSEVLRLSEPFTPLLTGTLIKTGILGTDIGSGTVSWIAPYANRQYYRGRSPGLSKFGPLRGKWWFERMNEVHGNKIMDGAKKIVGKGS